MRQDYEYVRHGSANLFLWFEPLTGRRQVQVTERRTKQDWARLIRDLVDVHYPAAKKVVLVLDNLNTHTLGSLYETFPPPEARRIAERLELHYTPKHGSWLNMAEPKPNRCRSVVQRRLPTRQYDGGASGPPPRWPHRSGGPAVRAARGAAVGDRVAGWEPAIRSRLLVLAALAVAGDADHARTTPGWTAAGHRPLAAQLGRAA
jgi:hypothetical protein